MCICCFDTTTLQDFTAMLRHGVLQPLIKAGKDPSDSDSYALVFLNGVDYRSVFSTSSHQIGFKKVSLAIIIILSMIPRLFLDKLQ